MIFIYRNNTLDYFHLRDVEGKKKAKNANSFKNKVTPSLFPLIKKCPFTMQCSSRCYVRLFTNFLFLVSSLFLFLLFLRFTRFFNSDRYNFLFFFFFFGLSFLSFLLFLLFLFASFIVSIFHKCRVIHC